MTTARAKRATKKRKPERGYVVPAGPEAPPLVVLPETGPADETAATAGAELTVGPDTSSLGGDGLRRLGARLLTLLESQERLQDELRAVVEELDDSAPSGSRARIKGRVRTLREMLEWCWAVHEDLVLEGRRAKAGQTPLDLLWSVRRVADEWSKREEVQVVVPESPRRTCWGEVTSLERLIRLALDVVCRRSGGQGPILVELAELGGCTGLRILATGEARTFTAPKLVERFRASAEIAGVGVEVDPLGPGAPGLVLRLPMAGDFS